MPYPLPALLLAVLLLGCGSDDAPEAATAAPADPAATTAVDAPAAAAADTTALPETNHYAIDTPKGRLVVRLYDDTPVHRDNFKRLAAEQFYDSTTFHRIIRGFVIQGGDPNSKDEDPFNDGQGGPGYTLPAEIVPAHFHRRGALAAARQGDQVNPERRSSGSQFYLVHGGTPFDAQQLAQIEGQVRETVPDFAFSDEARAAYQAEGGAPFLDAQYTVFGEVVEGFDVLDALAATPTPNAEGQPVPPVVGDQPMEHLPLTVTPLPDYE